jgi:hypothetical protein
MEQFAPSLTDISPIYKSISTSNLKIMIQLLKILFNFYCKWVLVILIYSVMNRNVFFF